jgi:hypothetical protein
LEGKKSLRLQLKNLKDKLLDELKTGKIVNHELGIFGAYVDLPELVKEYTQLLFTYNHSSSDGIYRWKIFFDGRPIGKSNVVWTISPTWVPNPQSPFWNQSFILCKMPETTETFRYVHKSCNLAESIALLKEIRFQSFGKNSKFEFIVCLDWVAISHVLGVKSAKSTTPDGQKIPFSTVPTTYLHEGWIQDPFKYIPFELSSTVIELASILGVQGEEFRYCAMHNVSRLLVNALVDIYHTFPQDHSGRKSEYIQILKAVNPSFMINKACLSPNQTKQFFSSSTTYWRQITSILDNDWSPCNLTWVDGRRITICHGTASKLLLEGVYIYQRFIYLRNPKKDDLYALFNARNTMLAVMASFKSKIRPANFYAFNTMLYHLILDQTSFLWVNEGGEHINKVHKRAADRAGSIPGYLEASNSANRWERMLLNERVFLRLQKYEPSVLKSLPIYKNSLEVHPQRESLENLLDQSKNPILGYNKEFIERQIKAVINDHSIRIPFE